MPEVEADQQKILCCWRNARFWRIIYSLATFSLGCIKTPWGHRPEFATIS